MKMLQAQCTLARHLATSLRLPVIPNLLFGPPHTVPGQHTLLEALTGTVVTAWLAAGFLTQLEANCQVLWKRRRNQGH